VCVWSLWFFPKVQELVLLFFTNFILKKGSVNSSLDNFYLPVCVSARFISAPEHFRADGM
jgi:hypothetical protein